MDEGSFTEEEKPNKVKRFIKETLRVLRITRRPNKVEYLTHVKVTGIGIALIGAIGFLIHILKQLLI